MASRPLIIATLVGASVAVPYFTSKTPNGKPGRTVPPAIGSYGQQQSASATRLPIVFVVGTDVVAGSGISDAVRTVRR